MRRAKFTLGAATALAAGLGSRPARAAQFEFRCASDLPLDHPTSIRLGQMWGSIERETGGRVRTQFFPNSMLGAPQSTFSQLRLGALNFLLLSLGNVSSVVPANDIGYLGFTYKDADETLRVMDGPLGAYLRSEALAKGLYVMRNIWDSGMYQITSGTHPIRTPEDMRGFKVRVIESRIAVDLFKGLGANPTALGFSEVYTALQTKVVDGTSTPLVTIETARFYEVQKYISLTNHAWSGLWLMANADTWKSLPPDLQEIVERNNTRYALLERRDTKAVNAAMQAKLTAQGITFNTIDPAPFRSSLRSYYDEWASAFGPTAWGLLQKSLGRRLG